MEAGCAGTCRHTGRTRTPSRRRGPCASSRNRRGVRAPRCSDGGMCDGDRWIDDGYDDGMCRTLTWTGCDGRTEKAR